MPLQAVPLVSHRGRISCNLSGILDSRRSLAIIIVDGQFFILRDDDLEVGVHNAWRRTESLLDHELLVLALQVVGL